MKIALAQLNSIDQVAQNLESIKKLVKLAQLEKPEIIFFPENSLFFRIKSEAEIEALALTNSVFLELADLANQTQIALHLTTAIRDLDSKDYNASIIICPNQKPEVTYRKIHLFDIDLAGHKPIRESDCFAYGKDENIFEFKGFRFGSSICYDLRFSELYFRYAQKEVDVILIPAAFLVKTGQAHWETLIRARAIESQCYVLAAAQSGRHQSQVSEAFRDTYGHTMAADPWGRVVGFLEKDVGLVYCELQKSEIESVRRQIPMKNHRRLER
jgi:predicted amidohydrolase